MPGALDVETLRAMGLVAPAAVPVAPAYAVEVPAPPPPAPSTRRGASAALTGRPRARAREQAPRAVPSRRRPPGGQDRTRTTRRSSLITVRRRDDPSDDDDAGPSVAPGQRGHEQRRRVAVRVGLQTPRDRPLETCAGGAGSARIVSAARRGGP